MTIDAAWLANGTLSEDWKMFVWFIGTKKQDKEFVPSLQYENRICCFFTLSYILCFMMVREQ